MPDTLNVCAIRRMIHMPDSYFQQPYNIPGLNNMPQMPQMYQQQFMPTNQMYQPYQFNPMQFMPGMGAFPEGMQYAPQSPMTSPASDPPPVLSNNPTTTNIVLFKELTGYPNYGNPSRNADILYTGNTGTWTFDIPTIIGALGNQRVQLVIRAVLDDHYNVPVSGYSARITVNGNVVHTGQVPLQHGVPSGGIFTNWSNLTFNVSNLRRSNRIVIENTSRVGANDWIAIDWMEMRLSRR